jgi:acetyltransferase
MAAQGRDTSILAADVFRYGRVHPLDVIFRPKTVAVVGATDRPGSVGRTLLWNLISNPFGGTVYPIHPKRQNVLGIKCYPSVQDAPEPIDLAVIATAAPTVPEVVSQCVEAGVRGALIISAGFRETGPEGARLEEEVRQIAQRGHLRVVGPNCLGVMCPVSGLNATFAHGMARQGHVGFLSQSGALCTAILDWSLRENVGFSVFVSVGSMMDVGWGDLIDYLGDDPHTKSILIYMESVVDARKFLSAAREVALAKPIMVIKAGRTEAAARAAASHTGTLVGSDEVLDAAFRRCGALRVNTIAELFYLAEALDKQPRPRGRRLGIVTNAGGPAVLAADALAAGGGELAPLTAETIKALDRLLPPHWSHANPVDVLGDADPERYAAAVELVLKDPTTDGVLVILTPQAMTDPTKTAERIRYFADGSSKPLLASWMGGVDVAAGELLLNQARIPTYRYPDMASQVFNALWRYSEELQALYETPHPVPGDVQSWAEIRKQVHQYLDEIRQQGRTLLTEAESKAVLERYQIPTTPTLVARTEEEAVAAAEQLGFPVAVKLHSYTLTHKTDVGGVRLGLRSKDEVQQAFRHIRQSVTERAAPEHFAGVTVQPMVTAKGYELLLGSWTDPQFGPVVVFGSGGELVEVYRDRSLALPPLTTTLARRLMERTRIFQALGSIRGRPPVNLQALEDVVVRLSYLAVDQPLVQEMDVNPLLASPEQIVALDARIILFSSQVALQQLPRPAIRPYPAQYTGTWQFPDGTPVLIRPIRPEDEPLIVRFHHLLSEQTVYQRYFQSLGLDQRVAHQRLIRICFVDYDREIALVAELEDPERDGKMIVGVGRLSKLHGTDQAEFALIVADPYQHRGLGTELLRRLLHTAASEGIRVVSAHILRGNLAMLRLCEKFGFRFRDTGDPDVLLAEREIAAGASTIQNVAHDPSGSKPSGWEEISGVTSQ